VDKKRALENIKEIIKIPTKESVGLYELKQHEIRFEEIVYVF